MEYHRERVVYRRGRSTIGRVEYHRERGVKYKRERRRVQSSAREVFF